jgi:hypothetical protein
MVAQPLQAKPRFKGRIRGRRRGVTQVVHGAWVHDLEFLEAISQDASTCQILLRLAALSNEGRIGTFLHEVAHDEELDDATKDSLTELAADRAFLQAVADYLHHTRRIH